jgi:hypothetical protein
VRIEGNKDSPGSRLGRSSLWIPAAQNGVTSGRAERQRWGRCAGRRRVVEVVGAGRRRVMEAQDGDDGRRRRTTSMGRRAGCVDGDEAAHEVGLRWS